LNLVSESDEGWRRIDKLSILSLLNDLESWWIDRFAFAERATARRAEARSFLEGKTTLVAVCRFHGKPAGVCRPGDVLEMIKRFSFFDAKELGNCSQIEALPF